MSKTTRVLVEMQIALLYEKSQQTDDIEYLVDLSNSIAKLQDSIRPIYIDEQILRRGNESGTINPSN